MTLALCALASLAVLRVHLQAHEKAQPAPARRRGHTTGQTSKTQVAKGGLTSSRSI